MQSLIINHQGGGMNNNIGITINMAEGTTEMSGTSNQNLSKLGNLITTAVQRELVDQTRPGGLLSR